MTLIHDDGRDESSGANDSSRSWVGWKERGKQAFIRCDYNVALQAYTKAINQNPGPSTLDQQILLSNMVACRLKLGGKTQAEAAVATAKKCIALNDKWPKGHVRLASAFIELNGDGSTFSNDACNALQRALQLDPRNPTAREMLVRELRSRDHRHGNPSAPPQHMDSREYSSSPGGASANNTNRNGTMNGYQNYDERNDNRHQQQQPQDQDYNNIDESNNISWKERIQFNIQKVCGWYSVQSEDIKTLLKVFLSLILLYVAFGGRFGLEYLFNNDNNRDANSRSGSYRTDNVYEEFYRDRNQRNLQQNRQQNNYHHHHREHYDSSSYDSRRHHQRSHSSSSWWDGSSSSGYYYHMLLMGGIAFVARYFGISPYQAIFFANMVMGRGGGRRRGMMGGLGNMRHRPGGMWR